MPKKPPKRSARKSNNESRLFPLFVAGLVCFVLATVLGIGSWNIFGSQARQSGVTDRFLNKIGINTSILTVPETATNTAESNVEKILEKTIELEDKEGTDTGNQDLETVYSESDENKANEKETEPTSKIAGVVEVKGGEFSVGGSETKRPLQRVFVEDFFIAESEVTNYQYAEFVKATKYKQPKGWRKRKYSKNTENLPVVYVSWDDANAFCKWMSKKLELEVRLPSQAEWELAARGPNRFLYPWGNNWKKEGVQSEKSTKPKPVKSFETNKSPFGAYDMLGNVWEWTTEKVTIKDTGKKRRKKLPAKEKKGYLALGGSFIEDRNKLSNIYWAELPTGKRDKSLGFRYVIIPSEKPRK